MHYRCAMVLGTATVLEDDAKLAALERVTEHLLPGRWADARQPNRKELAATLVLSLPLAEWSVKVSDGPPEDAEEDLDLPYWAGVVPLHEVAGAPQPAPDLRGAPPCRRTSRRGPAEPVVTDYRRALALARHRRRRPHAAASARPATSTSTWRSSAPATPGCGPRTTSRRPTRRCGSPCWRRRSPGSGPADATAAGARRCSRRRCPGWPKRYGRERAVAQHRAMQGAVDEVGARGSGGGHRLPLREGRHRRRSAQRGAAATARGPRSRDARQWGFGEDDIALLGADEARRRLQASERAGRDVHAALRRASTRRGWPAGWPARWSAAASRPRADSA